MKRFLCGLIVASSLPAQTTGNPFIGRWDFNVTTSAGPRANWLGVSEKNGKLEVWFQPTGGNLYEVKDFKLDGAHLSLKLSGAMTWELDANGEKLTGVQKRGDGTIQLTGVRAPVLILSARRSVDDRVRGLEQGGDDYLTKPFALAELLARLRNLLKRNGPAGSESTRLRVQDLELDLLRREATRAGKVLQLTQQEFVLLEYLCRNAGRVVTRSMILDKVWGMRIQPDTNVVDVHIYRLRGKVDGAGQPPLIRTMRGVGYVLKDR